VPEELAAVFSDPDAALAAVEELRRLGVTRAQVSSPAAFPVVHGAAHRGTYRALGWFALLGGIAGLAFALALQVATSKALGLVVGGKPIVAWTAFGVVVFELTMLFAGAANFCALVTLSAIERRKVSRKIRDEVSSERIVVVVPLADLGPQGREEIRTSLARRAAEVLS
jgi:hypothetical protein